MKRDQHVQLSEKRPILTPRELSEQSNAKMQEKYVLEKYKVSVEIAVREIEKEFKEYEKNPEKHPKYGEEWKAFWSRRYKELLGQGKDANGHDYKPEWIEYWTKRMKELLKIDISKKKEYFRKKLGLSIDAAAQFDSNSNKNDRRSRSRSPRRSRTRSPRDARTRKRSSSLVEISDDSDDDRRQREHHNKRFRNDYSRKSEEKSKSSRFNDDSPYSRHSDHRSRDNYDSYRASRGRESAKSKSPENHDDGPVSLISVCRLLSALESELGLLAKNVLDLLTRAVSKEKMKANSADELLFDIKNSNLLETVREKLKGVLSANLIEGNKIKAVKRAVQNIATLLHEVSKRKPLAPTNAMVETESFDEVDPLTTAKLEIAKVITASLIEQGRTDFTKEELEALVTSFMEAENDEADHDEPVVVEEASPQKEPVPGPSSNVTSTISKKPKENESSGGTGLENLTDEDLQTLLRNFADLTSDEQSHLIIYLSKIEQTNPRRVEKLRKFVNIGDSDDIDFDDEPQENNSGSNMITGVQARESGNSKRKSPEPMRRDLSDDEYDDDAMAKRLGSGNGSHSQSGGFGNKPYSNGASSSINIIKDSSVLADSLMSSLMQSSEPVQTTGWGERQEIPKLQQFYQQDYAAQYQQLLAGTMPYYEQQMNMNNMGMGLPGGLQMSMPITPHDGTWPQSASSNFFQEVAIPSGYSQRNSQPQTFKKRNEGQNIRQLTGKGKSKR